MPSTNGLASLFHFGVKTWRPKTAEQSYLEFEKKKQAEEVQRKQSEVQKKIELLDQIRKLEAKTQALNQMALSAEMETKEHELAMRERQMAESRQIELAKLDLAKRLGQESLDEADLARIRRERIKAELLAHASNTHAMNEVNRTIGHPEIDKHMESHMPQPPSFVPPEGFISPHPEHPSMAGPIPIHGMTPMAGPYDTIPRSDPRFMPASMPGYMHMSPGGRPSAFDLHDGIPHGAHFHSRRMSDSFATHPGHFDRGPDDFDRGPGDFDGLGDFERGGRGPSRNMYFDSDHRPSDQFVQHQMHPSNSGFYHIREPIANQIALRAQAERLWRKKLEHLDHKARQHNLNAQALRELRKRELICSLRERGEHQREIETQAEKLAEHDRRLSEAQLRELRDKEYRLLLKAKGLQEREIADRLRRREESDREILQKELLGLERELRRKEILEAEWAIRQAQERGEDPPLGVALPSMEEIKREGLLEDYMDGFHELNPRLQYEILSISAHHKPHSRMSSMNEINQARSPLGHTSRTSRAGGRAQDYEPVSRSSSRPYSSQGSPSRRSSFRSLAADESNIHFDYNQPSSNEYKNDQKGGTTRNESSIHDATLAARLQSAAVNSEINGGRRSRASSHAGQVPDDYFPSSHHRMGGDPASFNSRGEILSRSNANVDLCRSYSNSSSSEFIGDRKARRNGTPHSFETSPHSRPTNESYSHPGASRSPLGRNGEFHASKDSKIALNSRPQSRAKESKHVYDNSYGLNPEEFSNLSTEELERRLAGYGSESTIYLKAMDGKNLSKEEIERMSDEEFEALLSQNQLSHLATGISNLNVGSSQFHRMGGLSRHTSASGTHSSSSPHRHSSLSRVPSQSARSLSRGGTTSSHQSVSNRQDFKSTSRPATALDRLNDRPPSASRSPYRNSGQHSLAGDHKNDARYCDDGTGKSIYAYSNHPDEEELVENDITVTEMTEQPGAKIIKHLGKIQANARRNLNHPQQLDVEHAGLSERNEMHQAVNNLIAEASRSGANGIVSLRLHDLKDGSYDASGEAVIQMQL